MENITLSPIRRHGMLKPHEIVRNKLIRERRSEIFKEIEKRKMLTCSPTPSNKCHNNFTF